jgi:hypothetical protein
MKRSVPFAARDLTRPYFPGDIAQPGQRMKPVTNGRCCNELVIVTYSDNNERLPTLDARSTDDGAYVIAQSRFGAQQATAFDAAKHAGWRRFDVHVCKEDRNG